ncbi:MAG: aspartate aminotransferase family protein [Pseudomonadota bacterium]
MAALMSTYAPLPVSFTHGAGAELFTASGESYLDGVSGIAVTNLGHAHPKVTRALTEQAARLVHCSNLFHISAQERAAQKLISLAGMERVFFCNSGAEANEAALKLARLHGAAKSIDQPKTVVLEHAFHGRTLATLSATGNRKIQAGFEPLVSGFVRAPRNDSSALEAIAANSTDVVAVLLEPVQGEGGVFPLDQEYLVRIAELCKENDWLLMFDEVQSGNGRTGSYFYYQQSGVVPDVLTTAKALGNGVPIGACMARGPAARLFAPGHHGTTYGGNPLASAAASAVLDTLEAEGLPARAPVLRSELIDSFQATLRHTDIVKDIRGAGLMIGIELQEPCAELPAAALEKNILINVTAGQTVRLLPPLVMQQSQAAQLGESLAHTIDRWLDARYEVTAGGQQCVTS